MSAPELQELMEQMRREAFAAEGADDQQEFTRGERMFLLEVAGTALELASRAVGATSLQAALRRDKGVEASNLRLRIAALENRLKKLEAK